MKTSVFGKIFSLSLLLAAGTSATRADVLTWDPLANSGGGGTGTWNLNNNANWFNGSADVKWLDNSAAGTNGAIFAGTAGTVTIANSLSASNLQFTAAGYSLAGSGVLTLGSGGIDASALSSGTTTLGNALSLTLPNGQQPWQVGAGSTLAVNSTVTRNAGASVDFAASGITSTSLNNVNGILGPWATTGNFVASPNTGDWAANDGAGNIVSYTGYTLVSGTTAGAGAATQNWENDAAGSVITFSGSATLNSLVQRGDVIVPDGATLTLASGGLILQGISRWMIDNAAFNIGTATLLSGAPSGELFIHTPDGDIANNGGGGNWRIWLQIKDNGATPLKLIKDGPGCVILQNTNTYTGGTWVNNGILVAGGESPSVGLEPVTLGSGSVTVGSKGILEFGYGTTDATRDYFITNNVVLNGGKLLADDGHQHVSGNINVAVSGTLGSTYDGGGSGTTGNKALFIDGILSGNGPLNLQQAVDAGDNDRYGNGGGNGYNSSVVEFTNPGNTYSGTITVVPYSTGGGAGSYVTINSSLALQFATLNLANNPGNHRYAGFNGIFSSLVFNTGMGAATVANITGSGDIILNGFNENTYQVVGADPVTLTVGNSVNTTYSGNITGGGSLTKQGTSTLTLSGQNTFGGVTTIANGTLALTGSWLASSNVVIATGKTLNASALGTVIMGTNQSIQSDGTLNGSVTASAGSAIYGGTDLVYGTNAITGSLNMGIGALAYMDVGALATGANDRVTVGGTLTANNNVIHLKAPSASVNLDTTDYVLFSSANNISGSFAGTPTWDVAPLNAAHYSIVTSGKTVSLHYSAVAGPGGLGSTSPNPTLRNQSMLITVTAVNGTAGTVNSVVVDASPVGGSSTLALVNSGGNVWTNSVVIPTDLAPGNRTLTATVTDTAALTAFVNIPVSIVVGLDVWNGGGADNNLSTSLNWANHVSPSLIGDTLQFSGSTRLTPNVDNNYIVSGVVFTNASAFNIGSAANALTLTNGVGVVNNSANVQTLSTPITLGATGTFATASNDIVVSGVIADGTSSAGITKTGKGALTLSGANTYTGSTRVNNGTLNLTGSGGVVANGSSLFAGSAAGNSIVNIGNTTALSTWYILLGNVTNGVGALYQSGGTVDASGASGFDNLSVGNFFGGYGYYGANGGTLTVNGICIGGEANGGGGASFSSPGGNGVMEINGGAVTDTGWLVMARQNAGVLAPSTGILNVYSGSLTFSGGGLVGPWDTGFTATINIMGGSVTSSSQGVRLGNTGFLGNLNLKGGLLGVTEITGYNGPSFAVVNAGLLNLNGGTLQGQISTLDFIRVTRATVYAGGAVFDNNGNGIQINQPLLAPTGNGVNGIASFTGGAGYIAPPIVTITNGVGDTTGNGATAIAQINPASGIVTNVVITCPGVNYTATPVFLLSGGGATTPATITGTAPTPNITTGGITAIGSGVVALNGTNTYGGNTIAGAGTLMLLSPGVPPTSTMIVSNGAIVDLEYTGTNNIAGLVVNGVSQPQGTYNSTTSPSFISGTGNLVVGATTASNPTNITFSAVTSTSMNVSWPSDHLGWILQEQTNALNSGLPWTDLAGTATITSTNVPISPALPRVFFRLRHP